MRCLSGVPDEAELLAHAPGADHVLGDIGRLSRSGDTAFRVRVLDAVPEPEQRYWRGPVLWKTDGRSWTAGGRVPRPIAPADSVGTELAYEVTLEPTGEYWLFGLDIVTDLPGGTQIGLVAMVEVVALMIGEIVQCYSARRYDDTRPIRPGMFVLKGQVKSLYRPGSSVDLLLFQPGRMGFDADLLANSRRKEIQSRFTRAFQYPLVETEVQARSSIGRRRYGRKL